MSPEAQGKGRTLHCAVCGSVVRGETALCPTCGFDPETGEDSATSSRRDRWPRILSILALVAAVGSMPPFVRAFLPDGTMKLNSVAILLLGATAVIVALCALQFARGREDHAAERIARVSVAVGALVPLTWIVWQ